MDRGVVFCLQQRTDCRYLIPIPSHSPGSPVLSSLVSARRRQLLPGDHRQASPHLAIDRRRPSRRAARAYPRPCRASQAPRRELRPGLARPAPEPRAGLLRYQRRPNRQLHAGQTSGVGDASTKKAQKLKLLTQKQKLLFFSNYTGELRVISLSKDYGYGREAGDDQQPIAASAGLYKVL